MTATLAPARATYRKRAPRPQYEPSYWDKELGNIQLAIPPVSARTITASDTASVLDDLLLCDATSGAITVTLWDPMRVKNQTVTVKKVDSSIHTVTLSPQVGTIDGASTQVISTQYKAFTVQSDGVTWWITGAV